MSIPETLRLLRDSGLGSITGGGAEIFDRDVRDRICRGKETAEEFKRQAAPKKHDATSTLFGFIGVLAPFLFSGPGLILLIVLMHFLFVLLTKILVWLHLAPKPPGRSPWYWPNASGGSGWSSGSSDSGGGGFSGGGGLFGGGGSSGSW